MTKNSPRKQAIRAYMAAHGVNYTTAARILDNTASPSAPDIEWTHCRWTDPHPPVVLDGSFVPLVSATGKPGAACATCGEALTPAAATTSAHITNLKAALDTGEQARIDAAIRAHAPGPDPWDLGYALAALADDPDTLTAACTGPVTPDLLRIAVHAEATHGHRHHQRRGETAADICRSALLATSPGNPGNPGNPATLATTITTLANNTVALTPHATTYGFNPDYLTEALLLLAHDLTQPHDPVPSPAVRHALQRSHHHLVVTTEPLTDADRAELTADDLADYRYAPDRNHTIECPGITEGGCEGWEECYQCTLLNDDAYDLLADTSTAHGVEHRHMSFGWATATGTCSLQEWPDAWIDSAGDLDLPPGRYAIDFDWNDGCWLFLLTR